MSKSLSPHPEIVVLPSLPPSPSLLDEVFSHPRPWSVRFEDFDLQGSRSSSSESASSHTKGKGKQIIEDEGKEDDEHPQRRVGTHEAYPPMTDEAAETRRVEETLKLWELAERQRRKSARESAQYTSGPSFISSVTRTAGLVLSGRTSISTSVGPGNTRAFKSHEAVDVARGGYAVPLDDIDHHPRPSRDVAMHSPSPSPSLFERNESLDAAPPGSGSPENPFVHPSERTRSLTPVTPTPTLPSSAPPSPSPFADPHAQQAVQGDVSARLSAESKTEARSRSSGGGPLSLPPPRPLGLPSPPENVSHATQPRPTPKPVLRPPWREDSEERQEVRWWHEWLCGCGEGPDRGGDNQAGRTNPFE